MIGVASSTRIVGTAVGANSRTSAAAIEARWGPMTKYNSAIQEAGPDTSNTWEIYCKWVDDTAKKVLINLVLDNPAQGGEQVAFTVIEPDGALPALYNYDQTSPITLKFGQTVVPLTVTITQLAYWFSPRRLIFELEDTQTATVLQGSHRAIVGITSHNDTPRIKVSSVTQGGGAGGNVTINLQAVDAAGTNLTTDDWFGSIEVDVKFFDTGTDTLNGSVLNDGSSNVSGVTVTMTAPTKSVTLGAVGTGTLDFRVIAERGTNTFTRNTIDPDVGTYTREVQFHRDENLWGWSNDFSRDNTFTPPGEGGYEQFQIYNSPQGIGMPGWPTSSIHDGAADFDDLVPRAVVKEQTIASPKTDPVTGNPLVWYVPSEAISGGALYIRESFVVTYAGARPPGFGMANWIHVSYCIEQKTGSDLVHVDTVGNNKRTSQSTYLRVGLRARSANRNHHVDIKHRNVTSYGEYGDQTPAAATFVFDETNHANLAGTSIAFVRVDGTTDTLQFGSGLDIEIGGSATATASHFANAVAAINSSSSYAVSHTHLTVTVTRQELAPVYRSSGTWSDRPITATAGTGNLNGYATLPSRMVTDSIVDKSGRDMRPAGAGGSNAQYYCDPDTGAEFWFWYRLNGWNVPINTSGAEVTPTGAKSGGLLESGCNDAWGTWYGVERKDYGLCVYMHHYVSDRTSSAGDRYIYNSDPNATTAYSEGEQSTNSAGTQIGVRRYFNTSPAQGDTNDVASGSAYYEEFSGFVRTEAPEADKNGVEWSEDYKANPIIYPVLYGQTVPASDVGLNFVRNNNVGQMVHSLYWSEYDHGGTISDEPYSGAPDYFWPNASNAWDPRKRHATTDNRGQVTFAVT